MAEKEEPPVALPSLQHQDSLVLALKRRAASAESLTDSGDEELAPTLLRVFQDAKSIRENQTELEIKYNQMEALKNTASEERDKIKAQLKDGGGAFQLRKLEQSEKARAEAEASRDAFKLELEQIKTGILAQADAAATEQTKLQALYDRVRAENAALRKRVEELEAGLKRGDKAEAKITRTGKWWPCKVIRADGSGKLRVRFATGRTKDLPSEWVRKPAPGSQSARPSLSAPSTNLAANVKDLINNPRAQAVSPRASGRKARPSRRRGSFDTTTGKAVGQAQQRGNQQQARKPATKRQKTPWAPPIKEQRLEVKQDVPEGEKTDARKSADKWRARIAASRKGGPKSGRATT